ncbi:maltose / trehalose phosphorylase [Vibrio maritimus]|uniref:Maltose / trehalose phosphorylase n=1 Tax=Vibrio maritimus TaxID=990268 RepID=A0A090SMP7_9VIBR|nr:maltose / trehalose phosphorylase [Vibrio maritimus]
MASFASTNLPEQWDCLNFPIYWKGERLEITVDQEQVRVSRPEFNGQALAIEVANEPRVIESTEAVFNV